MSDLVTSRRIGFMLLAAAVPAPLLAQSTDADGRGDYHATPSQDIIVTAPFARDRTDILSGTSVLQGVDLAQAIRPTIGETLDRTPGVSATSFGPNASRPVLRGLQGERVRVLTDGIGSIDVSNTSVDHAVAIDPLLADRIEVLRGPSALLYGSSAIGGVVNILDKRIPRRVPDEPIHIAGQAGYGSAADERSARALVPLSSDDSRFASVEPDAQIGFEAMSGQPRAPDKGKVPADWISTDERER